MASLKPSCLRAQFSVADVRTVQGKTDFVGEKYILKKFRTRRGTEGVLKSHEIVAPERGLRISQWRKTRLWWRFKALVRGGN